jgi:NADPH:quinone reductase-like Zn-dependent oxidoreductase
MSPTNRASWLTTKQSPVNVVDSAPYTSPIANELVIRTKAIALNPADVVVQQLGVLLTQYPAILGCDVAGEVVEVDTHLSDTYQVGDRVTGSAACVQLRDGNYCYSGFQEYVVLKMPFIAKIPKDVGYEEAAVLPLGINTAASCLFSDKTLNLNLPSNEGKTLEKKQTVLIWGASSSVGSCGVQLATHAGYEVVGVASSKNHEIVKHLGARVCFDQNDPIVVDSIVKYLQDKDVVGAFSSVNSEAALDSLCEILDRNGGIKVVASVVPGAEQKASRGVTIVTNFTTDIEKNSFTRPVWKWLNRVMDESKIKYLPQPEIVGNGLEDVQKGVDLLAKGVSAKKLVISV